jgi:hypothetical protein
VRWFEVELALDFLALRELELAADRNATFVAGGHHDRDRNKR